MPRSNRPKGSRRDEGKPLDVERLSTGLRRTETKRGGTYTVQPISERNAQKVYTCPGCRLSIDAGIAHIVSWRSDGVLGESHGVDERRHWHNHCWRIA